MERETEKYTPFFKERLLNNVRLSSQFIVDSYLTTVVMSNFSGELAFALAKTTGWRFTVRPTNF